MKSLHRLFLFLALVFILSGCGISSKFKLLNTSRDASDKAFFRQQYEIGRSVEDRAIECITMGNGAEVLLFIASIHGNETAGTPLLLHLMEYIKSNKILLNGKKLVFVPIANPDGFFRYTRYNANGVDLNRNFSTSNRINNAVFGETPLSEPESRALNDVIEHFRPNRIISFHEPLNCIDYDGPAKQLAEYLSGYCELKVKKLGARPGSLGSYTGNELGIPTITLELPQDAHTLNDEQLWQRFGKILLAMLMASNGINL